MLPAPGPRPPSFLPRALAAARAALVRMLIASRSCCATRAITPTVMVFASGRSAATNWTPLSRRVMRKALLTVVGIGGSVFVVAAHRLRSLRYHLIGPRVGWRVVVQPHEAVGGSDS